MVLSDKITSDFAKECSSKTGMAYAIDQIYAEGSEIMCTEACPCHISDQTKFSTDWSLRELVIKPDGYTNLLDCPSETLSTSHEAKYASFLRTAEKQFGCAGICKLPEFFLFSDVNNGPPQVLC